MKKCLLIFSPPCLDINECAGHPCGSHGTCVDCVNEFKCVCDLGYSGETCQNKKGKLRENKQYRYTFSS